MSDIKLGKWYTYTHGTQQTKWFIILLHKYHHPKGAHAILSLNVWGDDYSVVQVEESVMYSRFIEWMDTGVLTLSTDPPSFNKIRLSDIQKTALFKVIFGSKE